MAYYWELCSLDDPYEGPLLMHMLYHGLKIGSMTAAEFDERFHPTEAKKREEDFTFCTTKDIPKDDLSRQGIAKKLGFEDQNA